jgi:membrane protease YdiL (CAAX protease family)
MADHQISRTTLAAVLLATTAALVARSWLQIELVQGGMQQILAEDVSYLVVPPILLFLLFPLWRNEKAFLKIQFRRQALTWRIAVTAIAIGVLIQLMWWSQLITCVSFGIYVSTDPDAIVGPAISFRCASPAVVFLGFFVTAFLVPLVEEITNRGYVQTALQKHGATLAVLVSATIFAIFHTLSSWPFAFFAGLLLGVQYWSTRSLWSSFISHATVNGLVQIDLRCLSVFWNPRLENIPILLPGLSSIFVFVCCTIALLALLGKMAADARAIRPDSPGL